MSDLNEMTDWELLQKFETACVQSSTNTMTDAQTEYSVIYMELRSRLSRPTEAQVLAAVEGVDKQFRRDAGPHMQGLERPFYNYKQRMNEAIRALYAPKGGEDGQ